jgi:hypothetical protein
MRALATAVWPNGDIFAVQLERPQFPFAAVAITKIGGAKGALPTMSEIGVTASEIKCYAVGRSRRALLRQHPQTPAPCPVK